MRLIITIRRRDFTNFVVKVPTFRVFPHTACHQPSIILTEFCLPGFFFDGPDDKALRLTFAHTITGKNLLQFIYRTRGQQPGFDREEATTI